MAVTQQQTFGSPEPTFTRKVLVTVGLSTGMVVLLVSIWYAMWVLLLMFAGVLLAVFLSAVADVVRRTTRLPYAPSLILGILVLLGVLVGSGWFAAPEIVVQTNQLVEEVPRALESVRKTLESNAVGRWLLDLTFRDTPTEQWVGRATGALFSTMGALLAVLIVLFVGLYLAMNPQSYATSLLRLVPLDHRPRAQEVLGAIGYTLRWWLVGQLITMACVGAMTAIGLWLMGIPLAFILGLLAFLLDFVPNFGPIVAAVPGVLLALMISPMTAVWVALIYTVVQQIESYIISPLVHQKTVHLPPVLTIAAQILLGLLAGPLGLLLATPLVAVAVVMVKMLYVEQALGDDVETPADHLTEKDKPPLPGADKPATVPPDDPSTQEARPESKEKDSPEQRT